MNNMNQVGPSRGFLITVFVISTLTLLAGAYAYYNYETNRIEQDRYDDIASIAQLKSRQIQEWRKERINEARWSASRPLFVRNLEAFIKDPDNSELHSILFNGLVREQEIQGYSEIIILDPNGNVLLSSPPNPSPLTPTESQTLAEALATASVKISELYLSPEGDVQLDVIAPIFQQGHMIALIVRRDKADRQLHPLVESWPVRSRTADTLLVGRDGDHALALSDSRHRVNTALSLREPLTRTDRPAVQAALGKVGKFRGQDFRGVDVLADLCPIPDSPWFLVAKMDTSEILAEANYRAGATAFFALILILLAGTVIALVYRNRQASTFHNLYQLEKRQREVQEEFRTALYSIGDAVITTDAGAFVKQMNPVAERLTGWSEADAKGKQLNEIFQIINEDSRLVIENPVQRVTETGKVVGLANHTVLVSRDGTEFPIADSAAPILDDKGLIAGVILVFRDQTEQRAAQKALQESEQRYRAIFDNAGVGIDMLDHEGKIVQTNQTLTNMLGYTERELRELTFVNITHPDDREVSRSNLQALMTGERDSYSLEKRYVRKDGSIMWGHLSTTSLTDAEGKHVGIVGVIADITGRKTAEEELQKSEAKFHKVFRHAPILITLSNVEDGTYLDVNDKFCQVSGYSKEEAIGKTSVELGWISPEDRQDLIGELRTCSRVTDRELRLTTKDRREVDCIFSGELIQSDDRQVLLSIALDITDRKQAEKERENFKAQLLQSQKMESVGTLAAGIAHDFNNMLQGILGYSEILLDEIKKGEPGHAELQHIVNTTLEARDLVQKIRLFSRKADIQPLSVDLNHQISELGKLLSHTLLKTINLDLHLAENLDLIKADPALMDQMVTNLAINASEAMPDGGTLTIETQNVTLDDDFSRSHAGAKPGPHILLTISDTGKGMSQEVLERIFDPFFSTKQRDYHRGTGLGLSIVKGIVDEHSGLITVVSEVGKGTTFKIYFPILAFQQQPPVQTETKADVATVVSETILLVEDEELVRDLGIRLLERFGYNVIAVSDGREAVEVYAKEQENIALVILDIVMPRMDGKECLQELLKINPAVKVLISSGVAQDDRVKEVVDLGAKGSLLKPYGMKVLQKKVREVIDAEE